MGTSNFETMDDFDLYVVTYRENIENDEEYDEEEETWFYEDIHDNFKYTLKDSFESFGKELEFFKIELKCGYYDGLQFFVSLDNRELCNDVCRQYQSPFKMDNEDCKYYFQHCKSIAERRWIAEINYINKKILPFLAEHNGFEKIKRVGTFSNGETIYEKVS